MIVQIVLFMSSVILVSSNAVSPILSAQTYNIYQQNGFANPSGNMPSDITSYLQSNTAQNQSPPSNLSPSLIRQVLLNKILSNPSMQTILDPNSMGYSSNLQEFPNNKFSSNLVSNYVAAADHFANNSNNNANLEDETNDVKTDKKSKHSKRRKSSKSRRKHDNDENRTSGANKKVKSNDINTQSVENTTKSRKKSKNRSHKHRNDVSAEINETSSKENASSKKTKRRKHKEDNQAKINPVVEENKVENEKPRRRHRKKKKNSSGKLAAEDNTTTEAPREIKEGINVAHLNEGATEENRVARNLNQEGNDLLKLLPNKPDTIANNYLKGMPQFENNPVLNNFFANYDNIYQSMMQNKMENTNRRENPIRKPPRNRSNQRQRIENKNKNITKEVAAVKKDQEVTPKIQLVTTESSINVTEKMQSNVDLEPKAEVLQSFDKKPEIEETTPKVSSKEDVNSGYYEKLPLESDANTEYLYDGYIDDYYPLFTDSAAYANNREFYIRDIGDNKYFYATDKGNTDTNRRRSEVHRIPEHAIKDNDRNKLNHVSEKEVKDAFSNRTEEVEEVIQFRTPPQLELPDFQTRQVGKSEIKPEPYYKSDKGENTIPRFVGDKSFTETKTPHDTGHQNGIKSQTKEKSQNVETTFARSKVVKYGAIYNSEEDNISSLGTPNDNHLSNYNLEDNNCFEDGGITYVIAKSLDD